MPCQKMPPSKPQPLDPDDLGRRLFLVLAERSLVENQSQLAGLAESIHLDKSATPPVSLGVLKCHSKSRYDDHSRKVKLQLAASGRGSIWDSRKTDPVFSSTYRHVPRVAASQFFHTTMTQRPAAHNLAPMSPKAQIHEPGAICSLMASKPSSTSPVALVQSSRRVQSMHLLQHSEPFSQNLACVTEIGQSPPLGRPCQTFNSDYTAKRHVLKEQPYLGRRMSSASVLSRPRSFSPGFCDVSGSRKFDDKRSRADLVDPVDYRPVDWTQSDEPCSHSTSDSEPAYSLRRWIQRWTRRSRLGSLTRHGKEERSPLLSKNKTSPDSLEEIGRSLCARLGR